MLELNYVDGVTSAIQAQIDAKQDALTFGISDTNVLRANANVVDNDFLRVDGTAIEGRSAAEMLSDIGAVSSLDGLSDAMVDGSSSLYVGVQPSSTSNAYNNSSLGLGALSNITTGDGNTAVGRQALRDNTSGSYNTALGYFTLLDGTSGSYNTGIGATILNNNTADGNTSVGYNSMYFNTTGEYNTTVGTNSLTSNTTGDYNSSVGYKALNLVQSGDKNATLGYKSGDRITTGSYNVVIGSDADVSSSSASNQIVIGYNATGKGNNQISLGNTSITAIKAQVTSITGYSDERIKREISDNTLGLEFIKKLRPVRYKLKNPADYPAEILEDRFSAIPGSGPGNVGYIRPQDDENYYDGLIAQEVKSAMDEVGIDWSGWSEDIDNGKQGLQYGALTVPLIKAVQEQQDMIESQREMIDLLIEEVKNLKSRIDD